MNFRATISPRPGTPRVPTINADTTLRARENPINLPIRLITRITTPPTIALYINFKINFNGVNSNLPNE